jgi:hypothetical protein
MKFMGLLIMESLSDNAILDSLHITRKEIWISDSATSFQPSTWNAAWFDGEESQADEVTETLSRSLYPYWCCDIVTHQFLWLYSGTRCLNI